MYNNNKFEQCDCINGVNCSVSSCAHHTTDNKCNAESIKVANDKATNEEDTFCSTFKPNSGCCG